MITPNTARFAIYDTHREAFRTEEGDNTRDPQEAPLFTRFAAIDELILRALQSDTLIIWGVDPSNGHLTETLHWFQVCIDGQPDCIASVICTWRELGDELRRISSQHNGRAVLAHERFTGTMTARVGGQRAPLMCAGNSFPQWSPVHVSRQYQEDLYPKF